MNKVEFTPKSNSQENVLSFYKEPPNQDIEMSLLGKYANERLQVLREIEGAKLQGLKPTSKEVMKVITKHLPIRSQATKKEVEKDQISHFILRLAFSQTEESRRWFLSNETSLFKCRWGMLSSNERQSFLKRINFGHKFFKIKNEKLREELEGFVDLENNRFCKVPFEDVPDMVAMKRVFISEGFAYVCESNVISILGKMFNNHLMDCLSLSSKFLPQIWQDKRMKKLLDGLKDSYSQSELASSYFSTSKVNLKDLVWLSARSFPPCMGRLHTSLKQQHHLRHWGRMQYGLFLKGIGLSLEDSLIFWKNEFTKKMNTKTFDTEYGYNIRHNYGKEGKCTNYTPYSCSKIINLSSSPSEFHGCIFRTVKHESLALKLETVGQDQPERVQKILQLSQNKHFQIACQQYWLLRHPKETTGEPISTLTGTIHPNSYYNNSIEYYKRIQEQSKNKKLTQNQTNQK
ncbi:DNA primase large subunit [Anaeramoeba flamelloides]|uniref:DNA primase large subunit n=1 Tax=Anaeramoeba flamelloides TaxID=1746091 RepID=A0ABQ8Y7K5_9EUKA|nr:DNA primase large subunit [Anaeramoeba flamelloides]